MNRADPILERAVMVASALLGVEVESVERIRHGGRNSRIFRVRAGSESFALKQYPTRQDDPQDRLKAEADALRLMERHHIHAVPRAIGIDRERGFLLLTWIDGSPVDVVNEEDVEVADRFLTAVHALRYEREAERLPLAAEACLSGAEIERQIRARLLRLDERRRSEAELVAFLDGSFVPLLDRVLVGVQSRMSAAGLAYDAPLPHNRRSLIPADFGFHNSLRRPDGGLAFLDFEYFGWDDPVKLTADFLLHPGMTLTPAARGRFRLAAERRYADDAGFGARLDALYVLFGLRWVLVLLNEFLPERWEERVKAGLGADWSEAKRRQLARAAELLDRMSNEAEGVVHSNER